MSLTFFLRTFCIAIMSGQLYVPASEAQIFNAKMEDVLYGPAGVSTGAGVSTDFFVFIGTTPVGPPLSDDIEVALFFKDPPSPCDCVGDNMKVGLLYDGIPNKGNWYPSLFAGYCQERDDPSVPPDWARIAVTKPGDLEYYEEGPAGSSVVGQDRPYSYSSDWVPSNPEYRCSASLLDAIAHTPWIARNEYHYCSDLIKDEVVGLADATYLTPALKNGHFCERQP